MFKRIKLIAFVIFLCNFICVYHAKATTITALSCSQEHLQDAIDQAENGDTVYVPKGKSIYRINKDSDTCINIINKEITIQGAGINKTIIKTQKDGNYSKAIFLIQGMPARVTGFTFDCRSDCKSVIQVNNTENNFRIDNCKFSNNKGYSIIVSNFSFGVIDHCSFYTNKDNSFILIDSDSELSTMGAPKIEEDVVFVEDCTFKSSGSCKKPILGEIRSRGVFRDNRIYNMGIILEGLKRRENKSNLEIYKNQFYIDSGKELLFWILIYGGGGLIYNNKMINKGKLVNQMLLTDQRYSRPYFWGNTINGSAAVINLYYAGRLDYEKDWEKLNTRQATFINEEKDFQYILHSGYKPHKYPHPFTQPRLLGDANRDGEIDAKDIQECIDTIREKKRNQNCDVNGDGKIDGKDVHKIIDIILE